MYHYTIFSDLLFGTDIMETVSCVDPEVTLPSFLHYFPPFGSNFRHMSRGCQKISQQINSNRKTAGEHLNLSEENNLNEIEFQNISTTFLYYILKVQSVIQMWTKDQLVSTCQNTRCNLAITIKHFYWKIHHWYFPYQLLKVSLLYQWIIKTNPSVYECILYLCSV